MYSRTTNRSRSLLVVLIVLAVFIITLFYGGGAGLVSNSRRAVLSVVAPIQKGAAAVTAPFRSVSRYRIRLSSATAENHELATENEALRREVKELKNSRAENERLRKLAGFRSTSRFKTVAAGVISRSPTSWQSVATIDFGSGGGAKKRQSVLTDKGLVGQIVEVTGGTALVQLLDDRRSGVAVEIDRTGSTGIVEGRMNGNLRLRFIAGDEDVRKGDKVFTSGIGGVHPRGIPVGVVEAVSETAYSLEKQIPLKANVDYRRLSEILIIVDEDRGR